MRAKAYKVTATSEARDGTVQAETSAEVLGEAHGRAYPTREAAQEVAARLAADLGDLDPSTRYEVEEDTTELAEWTRPWAAEDYRETEGDRYVLALVKCPGEGYLVQETENGVLAMVYRLDGERADKTAVDGAEWVCELADQRGDPCQGDAFWEALDACPELVRHPSDDGGYMHRSEVQGFIRAETWDARCEGDQARVERIHRWWQAEQTRVGLSRTGRIKRFAGSTLDVVKHVVADGGAVTNEAWHGWAGRRRARAAAQRAGLLKRCGDGWRVTVAGRAAIR